jgi:hypothetical protein
VVVTPQKEGVVVTFRVTAVEEYKIRLTDPADDVNVGYMWHLDPESVEFADITVEVCDGLPSDVEKGMITSDRYCPWSAEVLAIDE